MAAVELTISGVLYDKIARTTQPVVLIGEASLTGLGIGGGPIGPPQQPPGSPGVPIHPIWGPPGFNPPGPGMPPGIGGGPIIPPDQPPPDLTPPPPDMAIKPPPPEGGWAYVQPWGWGYYPGTGGPGPK